MGWKDLITAHQLKSVNETLRSFSVVVMILSTGLLLVYGTDRSTQCIHLKEDSEVKLSAVVATYAAQTEECAVNEK